MKILSIILIATMLGSMIVSTANVYNPNDPNNRSVEEKCLLANSESSYTECYHCRSGKSYFGQNAEQSTLTLDQTYGLRQNTDAKFMCEKYSNSNTVLKTCDQEIKISNCDVYDNDGLCIQCHCDFGLFYSAGADTKTRGVWQCIENEFRTRNCHKYDENKDCMECKWTKGNLNLKFLDNNTKLSRDFGLLVSGSNIYCVSNDQNVLDIQTLNIFTTTTYAGANPDTNKVVNCEKYVISSTNIVCVSCHNRIFDINGNNRWGTTDVSYDFWINDIKTTFDADNAKSCLAYPTKYITHPNLLTKLVLNGGDATAIDAVNTKCITGYTIHQNLVTGTHGCIKEIASCATDKHEYMWDLTTYKLDRKWFKMLKQCNQCVTNFILNVDKSKCLEKITGSNLIDCLIAKDEISCSSCNEAGNYYPQLDGGNFKCILQTGGTGFANCETIVINAGVTTASCTKCQHSYIEKVASGTTVILECLQYNDIVNAKVDAYTTKEDGATFLNKSGCKQVDSDTKACKLYNHGFDTKGACSNHLLTNIRQQCPTTSVSTESGAVQISDCEIYSISEKTTEGLVRCMKCNTGFVLDGSRSQCLNTSSTAGVENCTAMDGAWCKRCKATFQLTNENTCVSQTAAGFDNKNCRVAKYTIALNWTRKLQTCQECFEGYFIDTANTDCTASTCCASQPIYSLITSFKGLSDLDLSVICLTGEEMAYTEKEFNKSVCMKKIDNCRYYRSGTGMARCFECQKGYTVKVDGTCETSEDKSVGFNVYGERVKIAEKIDNCELYSQDGKYCFYCADTYFIGLTDNFMGTKCLTTTQADVTVGKRVFQAFSKAPVFLDGTHDVADPNCITENHYELYFATFDKLLYWRCAKCTIGGDNDPAGSFYMDTTVDKHKCLAYSDIKFRKIGTDPYYTTAGDNQLDVTYHYFTRIYTSTGLTDEPLVSTETDITLLQFACNFASENEADTADDYSVLDQTHKKCIARPTGGKSNCYKYTLAVVIDADAKCIQCYPGYLLVSDECVKVYAYPFLTKSHAATATTPTNNCVYAKRADISATDWTLVCARCQNGYILNAAQCLKSPHPACIKSTTLGECAACQQPYRLKGTTCILSIRNCNLYTNAGLCDTCYFGYSIDSVDGKCKLLPGNCQAIDFSKSYDQNDVMQVQYCQTCFATDTMTGNTARKPKQGIVNNMPGQYCHLGCGTLQRSPGQYTKENQFNNWDCCACDLTQFSTYGSTEHLCKRQLLENCNKYDEKDGKCVECNVVGTENYMLLSNPIQCKDKCIKNTKCATISNTLVANGAACDCMTCTSGNYLDNKICVINEDTNCEVQSARNICTSCKASVILTHYLKDGVCITRGNTTCLLAHADLTLTADQKKLNWSLNTDECTGCNYGYNLNTEKQCKVDQNHCLKLDALGKCILCEFKSNGYGLKQQDNTCIENSTANRYCQTYKTTGTVNECIKCYSNDIIDRTGWAGTVTNSQVWDSKNDALVCIELDYCIYGGSDKANAANKFCFTCMVQEPFTPFQNIFYTTNNKNTAICMKEAITGANVANYVRHCRRYVTFSATSATNQCIECHTGYHSDWTSGNALTGKYCLPDDSPCSLPACLQYQQVTHYEYLKCALCTNQWKFYTQASNNAVNKLRYNLNTYTRVCDNVREYKPSSLEPGFVPYDGKDGGILTTSSTDPDVDPINPDIPTDRDRYEPPVLSGSLLGMQFEIVILSVIVALVAFF